MDQVLCTDDAALTEVVLNDLVARDGNTLSLDLGETALVEQFPDRLQVGVAPCNVRLTYAQHVNRGLVELDEDSIVDLTKAEQLEDFADLRGNFVDTGINQIFGHTP